MLYYLTITVLLCEFEIAQVLEVALGAYHFVVTCFYLAAVWRRTLYSSANSYDDFRYNHHGRDGVIVIFLATLTSFILGLVLSFRSEF